MPREINPCGKRVTPQAAYEVYQDDSGEWTYYVLKKYKSPESEMNDPFARWYVATTSPMTHGSFEYGDAYANEIKESNHLVANPLTQEDKQHGIAS